MDKREKDLKKFIEKREFVRLKVDLPIEFTIVRLQGDLPGLDWQRGDTKDVSRTGLGLKTQDLSESTIEFLKTQNILLELKIYVPRIALPLRVVGEVAWHQKLGAENPKKFLIGLKYHSIKNEDLNLILNHAKK